MSEAPLILLSGPSGSGKSTLIERVVRETTLPLRLSISATTRAPRPHEQDGRDYYFWTRERFLDGVAAGEFLEFAEVHGLLYGTLNAEVLPYLAKGIGVILVIDVQGAARVRELRPEAFSVFIQTSSESIYEQRLRTRGTESEEAIQRRLISARNELARANEYNVRIINDDLENAVRELHELIQSRFAMRG